MVVSYSNHTLSVHELSSGTLVRVMGSKGAGAGCFNDPQKVCFSAAGNVLVVELGNKRVQEVTLSGDHVRFVGVGVIDDGMCGIAANTELIVVGKACCPSNSRIIMFDAVTGAFVRSFGDYGDAPGQLMYHCHGIRFTPDGRHIIVAESSGEWEYRRGRMSMFTLTGEFVRCIGDGDLKVPRDIEFADNGNIIVSDSYLSDPICVFSADGSKLLRQWRCGPGESYTRPTALAMQSGQLYVLDPDAQCVRVFV